MYRLCQFFYSSSVQIYRHNKEVSLSSTLLALTTFEHFPITQKRTHISASFPAVSVSKPEKLEVVVILVFVLALILAVVVLVIVLIVIILAVIVLAAVSAVAELVVLIVILVIIVFRHLRYLLRFCFFIKQLLSYELQK